MGNDALHTNPNLANYKTAAIHITTHGSDFYYAFCAVMGATTLGIIAASFAKPRTDRIFFYLTSAITMIATLSYFSMGSNLGWTPIDVEFPRADPKVAGKNRQIFYVRYIDWFITTPLIIMDLLLTAGMPWPTIIWTILLDWVMVVTGLVGALVRTRYKWGFFTFGCAAMFGVLWILGREGRRHAKALGVDIHRVYLTCAVWTLLIWICYPISWGVSEGGNVIAPDSEAVFYGVLDFCSKVIFAIMFIVGHWSIDPARLGLHLRDYDEPLYVPGEKPGSPPAFGATPAGHSVVRDDNA